MTAMENGVVYDNEYYVCTFCVTYVYALLLFFFFSFCVMCIV